MNRAGEFTAEVYGPYPCWVTIRYKDEVVVQTLRHDELQDLAYVVRRAMAEARRRLGDKDAAEVGT